MSCHFNPVLAVKVSVSRCTQLRDVLPDRLVYRSAHLVQWDPVVSMPTLLSALNDCVGQFSGHAGGVTGV